ncbi:MAG: diacylglycerol kinase family protein [Brevinematales bacterium]|nr:diacylglycerol kinase family protein [Brevinematales bacterium]
MFRRHLHPWWKSFVYAFRGLRRVFFRERNFRFHLVAAGFVILLGVSFQISWEAWGLLFLAISSVLSLEVVNTAVEEWCDILSPERKASIRRIKDIMAGAVFVASLGSVGVGVAVFWGYLWDWVIRLVGSK